MNLVSLRRYRIYLVFAMLVLLPVTGVLFALAETPLVIGISTVLAALAAVLVLSEEAISTAVDREMTRLEALVEKQGEKISALDEAVREEDRILEMMEERNNTLSGQLAAKSTRTETA